MPIIGVILDVHERISLSGIGSQWRWRAGPVALSPWHWSQKDELSEQWKVSTVLFVGFLVEEFYYSINFEERSFHSLEISVSPT